MAYTNFIWTFEKRLEYADGVSEIVYSVKAADQGYPTLNFKDYQVKGESGWNLTQTPEEGAIKGTVKSTQSNKGTLQILYKGIPIGKNEDEIAFNEFDIAISSSGNGADLAEDRMPGGKGAAPSPNEVDPGSVIISGTSGGIRSKLTLRGKAKEGSYQLSSSNSSAFAIYDAAEGGNTIALPQTLSATELDSKTYYVGSVGNAKESSTGMLTLTYQLPLKTNTAVHKLEDKVKVSLLPVDLDIVHPETGELTDVKEDADDGGYVSVQRLEDLADATSDVTPKTKLKIHAILGAQSTRKTRLKFNGANRYKIYRDEARTHEVVSEHTELNTDTTLFFHGIKKSDSRGGEQVTMQVKVNDMWMDGDSVKFTLVQSEFLIQVKAFIPYAWTEAEEEVPGPNELSPMAGKVAKGDLHSFTLPRTNGRLASPGFRNRYSTDREPNPGDPNDSTYDIFDNAPFRVCQQIILTPYKDLHPSYDLASSRKVWTAPSSDHYEKATSVDPTEISLKKGFKELTGSPRSGKPPIKQKDFSQGVRTGKIAELNIEAGATDGAMGSILGIPLHWVTADIHWNIWFMINSEADPLLPTVQFGGSHDSYPAYEIIVIQSDQTYKHIHNASPAAGAYPGPSSLDNDNAINIGRPDTIRQ
jgi:hypothetical protein